jgi:opacity protein-like surface antigen
MEGKPVAELTVGLFIAVVFSSYIDAKQTRKLYRYAAKKEHLRARELNPLANWLFGEFGVSAGIRFMLYLSLIAGFAMAILAVTVNSGFNYINAGIAVAHMLASLYMEWSYRTSRKKDLA